MGRYHILCVGRADPVRRIYAARWGHRALHGANNEPDGAPQKPSGAGFAKMTQGRMSSSAHAGRIAKGDSQFSIKSFFSPEILLYYTLILYVPRACARRGKKELRYERQI